MMFLASARYAAGCAGFSPFCIGRGDAIFAAFSSSRLPCDAKARRSEANAEVGGGNFDQAPTRPRSALRTVSRSDRH